MSDDESETPRDKDAQRRLDEAMNELDKLPPDELAELIRQSGLLGNALDTLQDIAVNSPDPVARANARRLIDERGLGLLLVHEADVEDIDDIR